MHYDDFLEKSEDTRGHIRSKERLQKMQEAEILYQRGIALQMNSQFEEALFYYDKAIELDEEYAQAWNNRGTVLFHFGQVDNALESYEKAIGLNAEYADAFNNRGVALHMQKRVDEALLSYETAISLRPDYAEALYNQGAAHQELGHLGNALSNFDRAIALKPHYAEAFNDRGSVLQDLQRYQEALASYNAAIELRTGYAEALNNRGTVLENLGRLDEALGSYQAALAIRPEYVEALNNQGNALRELGQVDDALASYQKVLAIRPDYAEALNNQAYTLQRANRFDEALGCYDAALSSKPGCAKILINKGKVLQDLKRFRQAMATFDSIIAADAACVEAISNKAQLLWKMKRFGEALCYYDRAISLEPACAEFRYAKGLSELALGVFKNGWAGYEWRLAIPSLRMRLKLDQYEPGKRWQGESSLAGKTLFLYSEHSINDTLQFCRYVELVLAQGANIILEVAPSLKSLMQGLAPAIHVVAYGEEVPAFDLYCSLMSLPYLFDTQLATIPATVPYLKVESTVKEKWATRFISKLGTSPRIGLAWSDQSLEREDEYHRLLPLEAMSLLTAYPFQFYALQNEMGIIEKELLSLHTIEDISDGLENYEDIAAAILQMDLVITMDTAVAHLAGALGKRVWILLPYSPEWRWHLKRPDSPWYPTARLFRQPAQDDWVSVVEEVYQELALAFP